MVRVAWTLNVVLAAGLSWALWGREPENDERMAWMTGDEEHIPGGGIRVLDQGQEWQPSFIVDFGLPMAGAAPDEAAPDGLIRLAPPASVRCRWRSPVQLEIVPTKPLRRATAYTLLPDPELRSADGRKLPEDLRLCLETARLRLENAVPVEDETDAGRIDLALTFDLPVDPLDLAAALSVRRADGTPLAFTIEDLPGSEIPSWKVRFSDPAMLAGQETLEVAVAESLTPRGGDLSLGAPVLRRIALREALAVTGVEAGHEGIDIVFNHGIPLPERELVALEPDIPFRLLRSWRCLRIAGAFPAGEATTVILRPGFPGRGTARLAEETRRPIRIPDRKPSLKYTDPGQVLSALAHPEVVLEAVNVDRVRVSVRTLYDNNAVRFAQASAPDVDGPAPRADAVFGPTKRREIPTAAPRNAPFQGRIDLRDVLGGDARGVHEVTVEDLAGRARTAVRIVQVTDLAVTCRMTPDAAAVHVTSLARGTPVAGAAVRILSPTNQPIASGETGTDGVAVLRHPRSSEDRVPFLIEVRAGDDRTQIDRDGFRVALTDDVFGGRPHLLHGLEAFVAPDRGAARPGETLRATAVVRTATGAAPAGSVLDVRWLGPGGRIIDSGRVEVPSSGLVVLTHDTGPDAPTGAWRLELRDPATDTFVGSAAMRVEAFVPDRIRVEARLAGQVLQDRAATVEVAARWLEGAPAGGLRVSITPRFDLGRFAPPGLDGFSFGSTSECEVPPGAQPPVRTVLDDQGRASVLVRIPRAPVATQALAGAFHVEVEDPSGRAARAGIESLALRPDFHLGIRALPTSVEVVVVDAGGSPATPPGPVVVDLERRRHRWWWTWRRRDRIGTESRFEREIVQVRTAVIENGRGRVNFNAAEPVPGSWLTAVVHCGDVEAAQDLGRALSRPEGLAVRGPVMPVAPGGAAVLIVDSPIAGSAFVTLEGTTLHGWQIAEIAAGQTEIPVQVPAGLSLPNVHAVVTVTAPQARKDATGLVWLAGGTVIPLDHPRRRGEVKIEAPTTALPETPLTIRVTAPGATRATVSVVDEGVLRHAGDQAPDPHGWFMAARRLDSEGADTGTSLASTPRFDPGVLVGGGDDGGDDLDAPDRLAGTTSAHLETLALHSEVALDAEGRAEVTLVLPPYEGRVRIAVIAAGPAVTGAATAWTAVLAPIGLRLAGPRMLAPGDTCEITVSVRNNRDDAHEIEIGYEARGGLVLRDPTPWQRIQLGPGEGRDFAVAVSAGGDGALQELICNASGEGFARLACLRIPVRPAAPFVVERFGVVARTGTTAIAVPGRWRGGKASAHMLVDRGPELALLPILGSLLDYPHGCIEQTTSILRGVLATRALWPRFYPDGGAPEGDALLATGVSRVLSMQTDQGGLGSWPGDRRGSFYATLLGVDLLLEARDAGARIPEAPLRRMVDRLAAGFREAGEVSASCAAAEVLSRAGRPVGPHLGRLAGLATLPGDRARLALALHRTGRTEEAVRILDRGDVVPETPREEGGLHRSPLQAAALELRARLEVTPASPRIPELAARLGEAALRPASLTTQEQGRILTALAGFHAVRAQIGGATTAVLVAGGRRIRLESSLSSTFEVSDGEAMDIESDGPLFGVLEISGFRVDPRESESLGVRLSKEIIDLDTGAPAAAFRRGRVYEVRVQGHSEEPIENLLLTGIVPGGFEIEKPELWVQGQDRRDDDLDPDRIEVRDDRVLLFRTAKIEGGFEARWRVQAVFPGTYAEGSIQVEALYQPGAVSRLRGPGTVTVGP